MAPDFMAHLPRLDTRKRMACPKPQSRVEQARTRIKSDAKAAAAFRADVWKRDEGKCRLCGIKVKRILELRPDRGEVHHVRGRNVAPADRYNVKAALLLCGSCHAKAQRHEVKVPKP